MSTEAPFNADAERAVLGSCLLDNSLVDLLISEVPEEAFYVEFHRRTYRAIAGVYQDGGDVDLVSVTDRIRHEPHFVAEDMPRLIHLGDSTPTAAHFDTYARIVLSQHRLRKLVQYGNQIRSEATRTGADPDAVLAAAEAGITGLRVDTTNRDPRWYADEALAALDGDGHEYVKTHYPSYDHLCGGLKGLVIIAGRPSMGKSSLARDFLRNIAARGERVALFSQDQSGSDVYRFEASLRSRVPFWKIRNGRATETEQAAWKKALQEMREDFHHRFVVDDYPYNLDALASRIRAAARWGASVIAVDYMQLISVPGTKVDRLVAANTHVSKTLKHLQRELAIPILALAQLSRSVEARQNKRPLLSDLRETGQIEQDADTVAFVFRESYYEARRTGGRERPIEPAEVIVAKQKDGPIGTVQLAFRGEFLHFTEPEGGKQ